MELENLKQGWLSPTGEFYECASYDHLELAKELSRPIRVYDLNIEYTEPDDLLLANGWVYIGISSFMCHEWRIGRWANLTPEQKLFLAPYFENSILPVNKMSQTRWEEDKER